LLLPLVAVGEELFLVVQEFFVRLSCKLKVGTLHNGIHGAGLLAESAVDALCHVNVVPGGPTRAVLPGLRLDGDGLGRADGLAQLAGDAPFVSGGVPPQGVLPPEAGAQIALLEGVVDGHLGLGTDLQGQGKATGNLRNEENLRGTIKDGLPGCLQRARFRGENKTNRIRHKQAVLVIQLATHPQAIGMASNNTHWKDVILVLVGIASRCRPRRGCQKPSCRIIPSGRATNVQAHARSTSGCPNHRGRNHVLLLISSLIICKTLG
jgi:hypothetical protein